MDTQKTGEFLRALRKAKGLTQEEVAEQLFLSPKTVSRWESGAGLPDINIISGVAALYGVTVDEILQGERKTDRSENLTEQTKRLKNDGRARMIRENLLKKYNVFFIVAVSVLGFFLLLEILLGFLVDKLAALVLMPLGMAAALLVETYGNSEIKRISSENEDDALAAGIEKTKRRFGEKISCSPIFSRAFCSSPSPSSASCFPQTEKISASSLFTAERLLFTSFSFVFWQVI